LLRVDWKGSSKTELKLPPLGQDAVAYIAQSPTKPSGVAIATFQRSVYVSEDRGGTWKRIADHGRTLWDDEGDHSGQSDLKIRDQQPFALEAGVMHRACDRTLARSPACRSCCNRRGRRVLMAHEYVAALERRSPGNRRARWAL